MTIRYTRPALTELDELLSYIRHRSPAGAQTIIRKLRAAEALIARFPFIGRVTDHPTIRRLRMTGVPYIVFYEIDGGDIIMHAVRHGARDPATMPDVDR